MKTVEINFSALQPFGQISVDDAGNYFGHKRFITAVMLMPSHQCDRVVISLCVDYKTNKNKQTKKNPLIRDTHPTSVLTVFPLLHGSFAQFDSEFLHSKHVLMPVSSMKFAHE